MSEVKAWCSYANNDPIMPKDKGDFTGYMIARFKVEKVVSGKLPSPDMTTVTLKGELPSLSLMFRYLVRFQRVPATRRGEYDTDDTFELLPRAGFVALERLPWTRAQLAWALCNEVKGILPFEARVFAEKVISDGTDTNAGGEEEETVEDRMSALNPIWFDKLLNLSEYYRLENVVLLKSGWPRKLAEIRAMSTAELRECVDRLKKAPWELCFFKYTKDYQFGEMGISGLTAVSDLLGIQVAPVIMAAVRLYDFIKSQKTRYGHTVFPKEQTVAQFKQNATTPLHVADVATAALMWLARNEHLLFIDADGHTVHDQAAWFAEGATIRDLQLPADEQLKSKIVGHLRRIHANFMANKGNFTLRPCEDDADLVCAVPRGALNAKQRTVMDHMLNNWLTVVQGAPGSGKTAVGITHASTVFHWLEVLTHVGRQASALCDLMGGHTDNARTIHGHYHRIKVSALYQEYAANKEVLILDEVYNADDWTFEKALAAAPEASRLILIGDPDQIRPIPSEQGAGTPALDIANAFPAHVIYLDENMRQRDDARQIYSVVNCVRKKQPKAIDWGRDITDGRQAVVLLVPVGGTSGFMTDLTRLIQRLRSDMSPHEIGTGREHSWQLITFYNGTDPNKQGDGVDQLNGHVETFLDRSGFFNANGRKRIKHKITTKLTMYEGFKFMFTNKFLPNVLELKKRRETKNHVYAEVFNGQIEVVKELSQIKLAKIKGVVWQVICWPRSNAPGAKGTRFLIHRGLHVDPSHIVPAWAVTSNKSMGGECENVGVYVPPGIERSFFDRSNIYVALSRPTRFLGVIGQPRDIEALIMSDPRPVRSGLFAAISADNGGEWKRAATRDTQMAMYVKSRMNIYDQTGREAYPTPTPICKIPWLAYLAIKKAQRKKFPVQQTRRLEQMVTARYYGRLYRGEPRQIRAIDSLFDEVPVVEDPNALLMEILAKGVYAPIAPEEEAEAAASMAAEFPDAYKRVTVLEDGEGEGEGEGDEMEFQLPGTPPLVLNKLGANTVFDPAPVAVAVATVDSSGDEDLRMKKEPPLKRALFREDEDEEDYGLPALDKKIKRENIV